MSPSRSHTDTRYRTIVADPPWPDVSRRMGKGGRRARSTEVPYLTMSYEAIANLPVSELAEDAAALFLWSTRRAFREGISVAVALAWGFEPVGEIIWGLRNLGMGGGALTADHEPVLVATRGGLMLEPAVRGVGVHFWRQPYDRGKIHSAKPDGFLDLVERLSPSPRLEMFARRQRLGWDTWGNEALEHVRIDA